MVHASNPPTEDEITVALQDSYYFDSDNPFQWSSYDSQLDGQWLPNDQIANWFDPATLSGVEWSDPLFVDPTLEQGFSTQTPNHDASQTGVYERENVAAHSVTEERCDPAIARLEERMCALEKQVDCRLCEVEAVVKNVRTE
ncbi:hypothetical protein J7T55_009314 [Diaporthe amygdali]|uniref:uncharacterized protein n=1 Tax=Phomopsis amygdali TaxID=1214568 RepID=UPI0022FEAFE6|nr:uncharacterized protein J7T55_009314 [Diaporthe amygdali]KAJ0100677.1 hypothetical protein J7T55_009314 [Diaporthe amygdali]